MHDPHQPPRAEQPLEAEPLALAPPRKEPSPAGFRLPGWITPLLVPPVAICCAVAVSAIALGAAALVHVGGGGSLRADELMEWIAELGSTRTGFLVLVLPGQLTFLCVAAAAALLSPEPFHARLNLHRGRLPVWTWFVLAAGTPMVGFFSVLLLSLVSPEPNEHLQMMQEMFGSHRDAFLLVVILCVAVLPGVAEELLFRGYMQARLARHWPAPAAIGLSAVVFAAAHLDPLHSLGVLPLGIWLGVVAWRCGSVIPAILGHFVNNAGAIAMSVLAAESEEAAAWIEWDSVTMVMLAIYALFFTLGLALMGARWPGDRPAPEVAPAGPAPISPPASPPDSAAPGFPPAPSVEYSPEE